MPFSNFLNNNTNNSKQLSYLRETALQGGLVMAKSGRLEPGEIFTDIIGLSSTTVM